MFSYSNMPEVLTYMKKAYARRHAAMYFLKKITNRVEQSDTYVGLKII
jgi:hypothetical protein